MILDLPALANIPSIAADLKQTLKPIEVQGTFRRTVNGELVFIGSAWNQKYTSTISGGSMFPPVLSGVWKGQVITVYCIVPLPTGLPTATNGGTSLIDFAQGQNDPSCDYPALTMMVKDFSVELDDWQAVLNWRIELEQV